MKAPVSAWASLPERQQQLAVARIREVVRHLQAANVHRGEHRGDRLRAESHALELAADTLDQLALDAARDVRAPQRPRPVQESLPLPNLDRRRSRERRQRQATGERKKDHHDELERKSA